MKLAPDVTRQLDALAAHEAMPVAAVGEGLWCYETYAGNRTCYNTLAGVEAGLVLIVTAHQPTESILAAAVEFLRNTNPLPRQYEIYACDLAPFDRLVAVGPMVHRHFEAGPKILHHGIWVAFPVHGCEIVSGLSADDLLYARAKVVNTIDWRREPEPLTWYRFSAKSGAGQRRLEIAPVVEVIRSLDLLEAASDEMEVRNWKGDTLHLVRESDGLVVEGQRISLADAVERVERFALGPYFRGQSGHA